MIHEIDKNIYAPYLKLTDYAIDELSSDTGNKPILLDAGCGHSTVLEEQYRRCRSVIGVDMDRVALNKNKLISKKLFSNLTDVPLGDSSVDIITSAWVMEHISEPVEFVDEIYRLLKSGGYYIFIAPNKESWYARIASLVPNRLHAFWVSLLYKRPGEDTYPTSYLLNNEKQIDTQFLKDSRFKKIEFIYNDDVRYLKAIPIFGLLANTWHNLVMQKRNRKLRVHLIGLYRKM